MVKENKPRLSGNHPVNYEEVLDTCESQFKMVQILDENGHVINDDIIPNLSDKELLELMERMVFARVFDEQSLSYSQQARLGFYAPSRGQEASQMASHYAFEKEDWLFGGYRDIPQLLAHGATVAEAYLWSLGHVDGGRFMERGVKAAIPQIIIGAQMIQAQGNALGQKWRDSENVTFAYTGDGGSSQGDTYEALNFAGRYQSPVIFYIQNNGYAISTPVDLQTNAKTLAQKAVAAGIPGVQVDGNDPLAVYAVSKQAREWAVAGNGPVLIETITNRLQPHSTSGDDPLRYRTQEDVEYWEKRDPLIRYKNYLVDKGIYDDEKEEEFKEKAKQLVMEGMEEAEATPKMKVSDSLNWQYEKMTSNLKEQKSSINQKEAN